MKRLSMKILWQLALDHAPVYEEYLKEEDGLTKKSAPVPHFLTFVQKKVNEYANKDK